MASSTGNDRGVAPRPMFGSWRPEVPSWLISMVLHIAVLLVLGMTLRLSPRQGAGAERTADVGIALKSLDGEYEYYDGQPGGGDASASRDEGASLNLSEVVGERAPVDPSESLPAPMNLIGRDVLGQDGMPSAGGMATGPSAGRQSFGGGARVRVFGVEGEGNKFVYVFDRSGSMGGSGRSPLNEAKRELIASLQSLDAVHQFEIIFYNDRPTRFNPAGQPGKLPLATDQNKERARRFVGSIVAEGSTYHEAALLEAIKLQPDVIFFLTDADEPQMTAGQLAKIQSRARGIAIHAIEFGLGPQRDPNNFLVRLADRKSVGEGKSVG